ncbi:hypothetical protein [Hanstruepera ponticola]|uniref:hypothetical protein n=1 Tax=Hanstruepera ponticola TaxID=2042995 RepID=UPI000CF174E2|nr:hypothetical protein [Hanstruepera ponticola]
MKTFVLGIIFLGFTNLMCAQNDVAVLDMNTNMYSYDNINNELALNHEYINSISEISISKKILKLQNVIANYNIKTSKVYRTKSNTTYTVKFTEGENRLNAIYDRNGLLLSSQEHYQSIKLPYELSSSLIKENPGWCISEVYCNIQYNKDVNAEIIYKVVLDNGKKKKTVKINA